MQGPLQRLKNLPWLPLLQVTALAVLLVTAIDATIVEAAVRFPSVATVLQLVARFGPALLVAAGVALGALAAHLLERLRPDVYLNTATLWGLVPGLFLWSLARMLLPLPGFLFAAPSYPQVVGTIVGIFWRGRRYWRR